MALKKTPRRSGRRPHRWESRDDGAPNCDELPRRPWHIDCIA